MQRSEILKRFIDPKTRRLRMAIALAIVLLSLIVLIPLGAGAQIGMDPCCSIMSAGLQVISGLLRNSVAAPLGTIKDIESETSNYEHQVLYPLSSINQARSLSTQL